MGIAERKIRQKEEFSRLRNDIHAYKAFADFFSEKVKAALYPGKLFIIIWN